MKWVVPIAIGGYLIFLPYTSFSEEERALIFQSIKSADFKFVGTSLVFAFLSHLSRAWRWNYMLKKIGDAPTFLTNIMAIGTGYVVNLIIPRGGEVARAGVVKRTNQLPIDKTMGTIVAERVLDLVLLLTITSVAFFMAADEMMPFISQALTDRLSTIDGTILLLLSAVGVLILLGTWYVLKRSGIKEKVVKFLSGIKDGFSTIWTMDNKLMYLLHTIFIWGMYLSMFYICFLAIPQLAQISAAPVICAFVAGSFSVAFINGGFGAYPYLISQVLLLFGYQETLGTSIGWILWLSQTVLVIVYGLFSMLLISVHSKV